MSANRFLAVDIETNSLDWLTGKILSIGFSDKYYFCEAEQGPDFIKLAGDYLAAKSIENMIVWQNGSFDVKFLWANGVVECENQFDTMIAAYLLTDRPIRLGLDSLASYYLGLGSWKEDFKSGAALEDPELLKLYCLKDAEVTCQLASVLETKLHEEGKYEFFQQLMEARRMLTRAEYRGVKFDTDANTALIARLNKVLVRQMRNLNKAGAEVAKLCPLVKKGEFNWSSPKQVLWLLKHLGLRTINPLTKKESADITVLEMNKYKHPLITSLMGMRGTKKLISTLEGYNEALRVDGALHPGMNCTNTRTGRLSSSGDLNFQQVDKRPWVRNLFRARPGHKFVIADLAQIEVRMAAHYSKDPILVQTFKENLDFYGNIACQILGANCSPNEVKRKYPEKRQVAKVIGLSVLYSIGCNKLASTIRNDGGIRDFGPNDARKVIDDYFTKFAGLKTLQSNVHKAVDQKGHLVNLLGRKVDVSPDEAYMTAVNSLLQSSASDYLLFKAVEFMQTADNSTYLLGLIHDEILIEVPEQRAEVEAKRLKALLEQAPSLRVPIIAEVVIGDTWSCKG